MNARVVLLHPYVPEGAQIIIEANGQEVPIPVMVEHALSGARVFWMERLAGREGVGEFTGPKLVTKEKPD